MHNIYDARDFDFKKYHWNERAHRLSLTYTTLQYVLYALTIALLAWALFWLIDIVGFGLGILPCLGVIASIALLNVCLRLSLARSLGKHARTLSLDERHDVVLYQYQREGKRHKNSRSGMLLTLAQLDLGRSRYDLARLALGEIDASTFNGDQLKVYDLLWIATSSFDGHRDEATTWLTRYTGIPSGASQHADSRRFPTDATVQAWVAGQASEQSMQTALAQLGKSQATHPILPTLFGLMLAHVVFFLSLWLGTGERGWYLRIRYAKVGGVLAAIFLVVLAAWTLYLAYRRHRTMGDLPSAFQRALLIVGRVLIMGVVVLLALYVLLAIVLSTDGSERVIATNVVDVSSGRGYDYLAIRWNGYDPGEATTRYYRASDPILMESWTIAEQYDTQATGSDSSSTSDGATDSSNSEATGSTDSQPSTAAGQSQDGDDSDESSSSETQQATPSRGLFSGMSGYSQAVQNQMQAVYLYIHGEGILSNMSFSLGADAKGNDYATVSSGTESKDGTDVAYEYRLYDNGEAVSDGSVWEEIVLEKVYPSGGYDTELAGFYLLDPVSLEVKNEHKTTW